MSGELDNVEPQASVVVSAVGMTPPQHFSWPWLVCSGTRSSPACQSAPDPRQPGDAPQQWGKSSPDTSAPAQSADGWWRVFLVSDQICVSSRNISEVGWEWTASLSVETCWRDSVVDDNEEGMGSTVDVVEEEEEWELKVWLENFLWKKANHFPLLSLLEKHSETDMVLVWSWRVLEICLMIWKRMMMVMRRRIWS